MALGTGCTKNSTQAWVAREAPTSYNFHMCQWNVATRWLVLRRAVLEGQRARRVDHFQTKYFQYCECRLHLKAPTKSQAISSCYMAFPVPPATRRAFLQEHHPCVTRKSHREAKVQKSRTASHKAPWRNRRQWMPPTVALLWNGHTEHSKGRQLPASVLIVLLRAKRLHRHLAPTGYNKLGDEPKAVPLMMWQALRARHQ
mmetsp:Transcript_31183/g.85482  ORF Transcript_31183/g.85482 Transcript_31183/m.85482 type:complete len:200 (-) Transcript_31183:34-633(-)